MSLSREAILSTAQRLLTDYGLEDLTMRRLASELNVRAGALYYHVPNKQELLLQVARRSHQGCHPPSGPWQRARATQLPEAPAPGLG